MVTNCDVIKVKNGKDVLGSTPITLANVEQAFREYTKDDQLKLIEVDVKLIGAGQGFTSYVLRLVLNWKEEDKARHGPRLPGSAILKSVSLDVMEKLFENFNFDEATDKGMKKITNMMITKTHETECAAYELLNGLSVPPVPIARAYALWTCQKNPDRPPMILLEDLGDGGRVLGAIEQSLNYQQILALAEAQANLHAWCMSCENDKWKEKLDTMEDRMKMFENFTTMWEPSLKKAKEITFSDELANLDMDKTRKLLTPETVMEVYNWHKECMPDVLVHGDFWANNIMFNKLPDGSMGDQLIAFIDWQLTGIGNPMIDLGRVLVMSFDPELREKHFEDIIGRYYSTLENKLGPNGIPKEMTFDRVLICAHKQTAYNCLMMIMGYDMFINLVSAGTPEGPELEAKRQTLLMKTKKVIKYMIEQLNIGVSVENGQV